MNKTKYIYKEISEKYEWIGGFCEGFACVKNKSQNIETGYIDKTGSIVIPIGNYNFLAYPFFSEELAVAINKDGKYRFIDKTGEIAIQFTFDGAYSFQEGLAGVKKDSKWGYIDKKGEIVIPLEYEKVSWFIEGIAYAMKNGKHGCLDKTGKIIVPFEYDFAYQKEFMGIFKEGLMAVSKNGKKGYVDKTGNMIITLDQEYERIGAFTEGYASVMEIGSGKIPRWSLIDRTGQKVISVESDYFISFNEGLAVVSKDSKQKYINPEGDTPFETDFDQINFFKNGIALVKKDGKCGFINKNGGIVISLENDYDSISYPNTEGHFPVRKNGKCGYIDELGDVIIPIEYDSIGKFQEGFAIVQKCGNWGILEIK